MSWIFGDRLVMAKSKNVYYIFHEHHIILTSLMNIPQKKLMNIILVHFVFGSQAASDKFFLMN